MIDRIAPIGLRHIAEALHKDAQPRTEQGSAPGNHVGLKSQISDLSRDASASPVGVDSARVTDIRNAISSGNYKIVPDAVAASILKFYRS